MVAPSRIKEKILNTIEELPAERMQEVLDFVEFLRRKTSVSKPKRIVRLRGLWADIPFDVTNGDIRLLRRQVTTRLDQKAL